MKNEDVKTMSAVAHSRAANCEEQLRGAFEQGFDLGYKRGQEAQQIGLQVVQLIDFGLGGVQLHDLCQISCRNTNSSGALVGIGLRKHLQLEKPRDLHMPSFDAAGLLQSQLALGKLLEYANRRIAILEMGQNYAVNRKPFAAERLAGFDAIEQHPSVQANTNARGEPNR